MRCSIAAETASAVRSISALQSHAGSPLVAIAKPPLSSHGAKVGATLDRRMHDACPGFAPPGLNSHRFANAQSNESSSAVILIALRGGCSFRDKAHFAEMGGYRALVIADTPPPSVPLTLPPMSNAKPFWHRGVPVTETQAPITPGLGAGHGISIPVFLISALQGQYLANHVLSAPESRYFFRASIEFSHIGTIVDTAPNREYLDL